MELKEFIDNQDGLEEDVFNRDNYAISKKTAKMIDKLKKRRDKLTSLKTITDEQKRLSKAIDRAIPIMESFRKYFVKLETELYNENDEEKRKLIEAKYDDIKTLFINELYKVMESVSYRPSILIASLIAWIIVVTATPFTNWMLIPTYLSLRNISNNKKKITNKDFYRELEKVTKALNSKKRLQYRSYKNKEVSIPF